MVLQIEEQRNLIAKFVKSNIKFKGNEDLYEDFCNEAYQKSYIIFNSSASVRKIESYVQKVVNTSIIGVLKDSGRLKRTTSGFVKIKEIPFVEEQISREPIQKITLPEQQKKEQQIQFETVAKPQKTEFFKAPEIQEKPEISVDIKPIQKEKAKPIIQNTDLLPSVEAELKEEKEQPTRTKITSEYVIDIEDPRENVEEEIIRKDLLQRIADAVCVIHSDNPNKLYLQIYEARYIRGLKQKKISAILGISQSEVSKRLMELSELIKNKIVG